MAVVKVRLSKTHQKPTMVIAKNCVEFNVLIDTGAHMPVWNETIDALKLYFPDVIRTNMYAEIGGFGGKSIYKCDVWKIPEFKFEDMDGNEPYIIKDLLVAVYDAHIVNYSLILSSTMFSAVDFGFINRVRRMGNSKYMFIEYDKDNTCFAVEARDNKKHVLKDGDGRIKISSIAVYNQED